MRLLRGFFACTILCALTLSGTISTSSAGNGKFPVEPAANQDRKWRIAYYEGGAYFEYQQVLVATIKGLMQLGWVEQADIPEQPGEETKALWRWLSEDLKSDYLEFARDAHYSSNWDEDGDRAEIADSLIERLNGTSDIDLVIAMGTWAGRDLANSRHDTPAVVLAASDPVAAGIIKSIDDSGLRHIHAAADPEIHERQIRIFHEMVRFKKLGVAYEDSVEGRSSAAVGALEKVAAESGFEIVPCYTQSDIPDLEEAGESVIRCFQTLVGEVEAIYVTMQGGVRKESIPRLVEISNDNRIPTFSQAGSEEVSYGFLASLSQGSTAFAGRFNACTMARIFNGAPPNELVQRFEPPPKITINLKTAELAGLYLRADILAAADQVFETIESPK